MHRVHWTIQPLENLPKITPLTLVAHRQIRRQKGSLLLDILLKLILYVTSSLTYHMQIWNRVRDDKALINALEVEKDGGGGVRMI